MTGAVMRIENRIVIRRPVEAVYRFVADLPNELQWQPEITAVRLTSPGPLQVGSTFIEVRRTFGVTLTWDFTVTALTPGRLIGIQSTSGLLPYAGTRRFDPVPGGTLVTESGWLTLPAPLRIFTGLLERLSARPVAEAYRRLKRILES